MTERSKESSRHRELPSVLLSSSHHAHLFPKTQRFTKQNPECPEAFYNYESLLSRKTTGFGYGRKSDFTKTQVLSPGSNKYNLPSPIGKGQGRSFACSRDESPVRSYIPLQLKSIPGPGEYQDGLKYRGVGKQLSKTIEAVYPYVPGNYFPSKYKSSKYGTIDSKVKRFPGIRVSPGPGEYYLQDSNHTSNGYVVSNFRGRGSRHFDQEARFTDSHWKVNENPGPGRYESKETEH